MRAPLMLLLVALAGCAAAPEPAPAAPLEASRARVTLSACEILEAPVDVPEERVVGHVPPGFSARASNGVVPVVLGVATCAQGSRAFLAIAVTPEDPRLQADGVRHFFEPEHLVVSGEAFAAALAAARGNATSAVRIDASAAPPQPSFVVETGSGTHRAAGIGAAVAPAPEELIGGVFREWFPADGGYGYIEASFGTQGATLGFVPARVETGEGTIAHEVIGSSAESRMFVLDGSAYAEASLGFVPYP